MSTTDPFHTAALIGPASAPVAQWLELVRVSDTESLHLVCQAYGRGKTRRSSERTIKRLEDAGLAIRSRRAHTADIIATASAGGYAPRSLAHDLIVSRISAHALECGWAWERDVADRNDHHADGILYDDSGRRIAVEIEMTRKTIARTRQILLRHSRVPHRYNSVLYVGPENIMTYIARIAHETGTGDILCGTVDAVSHWTHEIDGDKIRSALKNLAPRVQPLPVQLAIGEEATSGEEPRPSRDVHTPPPQPRPSAASAVRVVTDAQILDFRVPLPRIDWLTDADHQAARAILANRLTRAEISNDTKTVAAVQQRQKELGYA